jgi:flagellar capping protein FliD
MGELRLPGLFTGIDTATLINQLMAVERRTLTKYQARQSVWTERKSTLAALEAKLQAVKSAAEALSDAGRLRTYRISSSDQDIVTAQASNNAFEGNHTVTVNQLATAERWVHTTGMTYAEDCVGAGTFIYSYGDEETVITTTAETTLEDLVGLINNDADNPGVTANLLYHNNSYHLVLNGNDPGSDHQITVRAANTEVWQTASPLTVSSGNAALTDKITALDQFDGPLVGDEYITISGKLHDGTDVSRDFSINSNTRLSHLIDEITDVFGGTAAATLVNGQIRLTDHTDGASQMQLSLAYNAGSGSTTLEIPAISQLTEGGSISASLAEFAPGSFTETQSAQDAQIKVDGYPSDSEEWITRSSNTVDDVIHGVTLTLQDTGTVQVNLARNTGTIKSRLDALVTAYNDAVTFVDEQTGYNADLKSAGILMGNSVVSGIASDMRSSLVQQAQGFVAQIDRFTMPGQIGLELKDDGTLELTSDTLDAAIAEDYFGILAIIGADKTGTSDSNTIEFYGASAAYTTAGTYNVEVTVAGGVITSARIKLSSESEYRDADIDGNTVTGDSDFDNNGDPLLPENGLQLSVDLTQEGTFTATVRIQQGFAGAMVDALNRALDTTDGSLQSDRKSMDDQIQHLQDRIDSEQKRLDAREERLVAKYARLERTLALLQNQIAALGLTATPNTG